MKHPFTSFLAGIFALLLCIIAMLTSAQASSSWTPKYGGTTVNGQFVPLGYYEYLPSSYNSGSPLSNYSVVIFFHGAGEYGNGQATGSPNLSAVLNAGVPHVINTNTSPLQQSGGFFDTNNVIVLCPQHNDGYPWSIPGMVRPFLNFAMAAYPKIDKRRIWVTGLSYGSWGCTGIMDITQDLSPDDMAASIGCAWRGDDFGVVGGVNTSLIGKIVPLWLLTSQGDISSSPDNCMNNLAAAISGSGSLPSDISVFPSGTYTQPYTAYFNGSAWTLSSLQVDPITAVNPKITYFTGSDHNSWDRTYTNTNTWNWLFQQQKPDVTISTPSTANVISTTGALSFAGSAQDKSGTSLTGSHLQWIDHTYGTLLGGTSLGTGASMSTSSLSVGVHDIRLEATDSAYRGNHADVTVTVPYTSAFTAKFNFQPSSAGTPASGHWNTINGVQQPFGWLGNVITNAVDYSSGSPVGLQLMVTKPFSWTSSDGTSSTTLYPSPVQQYGFAVQSGLAAASGYAYGEVAITGCNPSQTYTVTVFGSAGYSITSFQLAGATTSTQNLTETGNTSNVVSWTMSPDSTGRFVLDVNMNTGSEANLGAITVSSAGSGGSSAPSFTDGPPPSTGTVGTSYSFTYTANGTPTPTFTKSAGTLPPGLTLASNGALSGTPTTGGVYSGTVTATNSAGSANQNFSITVNQAPAFTDGPATSTGTVGTAYSFTYTASGYPAPTFTKTAGTLPPGLTLTSGGVLSGTPTTAGTYSGTVGASNTAGSVSQNYSITISSSGGGGSTTTYLVNLGGPHTIGGANPGKDANNLWWNNLAPATVYSGQTLYSSTDTTNGLTFSVNSPLIMSGANNSGTTVGVTSPSGTVYTATDAGNEDWTGNTCQFTIGGLDASGATQYTFIFFSSYSGSGVTNFYALSGGTTYAYSAGVTPVVNSSANYNNGSTPTFETYTFTPTSSTVTVTESSITGNTALWGTLEITAVTGTTPTISGTAPGGTVGTAYSFTYSAAGSPAPSFTVSAGSLPAGLSLNTSTGVISGTPTTTGTSSGTVRASNGFGSATVNFNITINPATVTRTYLINLGGPHTIGGANPGQDTTGLWWNNLAPATVYSGQTLYTSTDTTNGLTFSVASTLIMSGANTSGTTVGVTSPAGTVYSASAAGNEDWTGNTRQITIGGLDTTATYTMTFFSSCSGSGVTNFYSLSGGTTYSYSAGVTPVVNSSGNYNNGSTPTFEQYTFTPTSSTVTITENCISGSKDLWGTLEITAVSSH